MQPGRVFAPMQEQRAACNRGLTDEDAGRAPIPDVPQLRSEAGKKGHVPGSDTVNTALGRGAGTGRRDPARYAGLRR